MTNGEKFKTANERRTAYENYCEECGKKHWALMDEFGWLDLEYKEELKPCPFCGSSASLHSGTEDHEIVCSNPDCDAAFIARSFSSIEEAIAAWNRRVS